MTAAASTRYGLTLRQRLAEIWHSGWGVPVLAGLISAILFAITLQTHINGSTHPYTTDAGELQNALPRWGTIHFTGYPLYSITGSLFVTLLRLIGVQPATGASLVSLVWGALTAVMVAFLALELGVRRLPALLGALTFSISTSMWIDSSLAEVHSMSMFFVAAIMYFAVRFDRTGERRDLLWLGLVASQGVFHGRAIIGLMPAVALIVLPRWRLILRNVPVLFGISLLGPLLYLYLPLREWMGAYWTYGNTSTWEGFWRMLLNIKAGRFASITHDTITWPERLGMLAAVLENDLPLPLMGVGLAGLFALDKRGRDRWRTIGGLVLAWTPFAVVPPIVYAGFVGDAILAIKLPVSMFAGLGLGMLLSRTQGWPRGAGYAMLGLVLAVLVYTGWRNFPRIIEITRDRGNEETFAIAEQAAHPDRPTALMILWGHNYWTAAYAQKYRGQLEGVRLLDHNADFAGIVAEGYRLLTLSETFYQRPVDYWEGQLGPVYLDGFAPGLVEIRTTPREADPAARLFTVNNELAIESASVTAEPDDRYRVDVRWRAEAVPARDYSVAVHLVAADPPGGPQDILAQADTLHPVEGWYPTTRWAEGQVVQETFRLEAPPGAQPAAVRITAYYVEGDTFINGEWLVLPVEP